MSDTSWFEEAKRQQQELLVAVVESAPEGGDGVPQATAAALVQVTATLAVAEEIRALREVVQGATRITVPRPKGDEVDGGIWPRVFRLDTVLVDTRGEVA